MARIKIQDLSKGTKVSKEMLKSVRGGYYTLARYPTTYTYASRYPTMVTGIPITAVNWGEPEEAKKCKCMGMPQDPVTEVIAG